MEEMRRSPRVHMPRLRVALSNGRTELRGNLSSGGVGFELRQAPAVGDRIRVELVLPDEPAPIEVEAEVCYVQRSGHQRDAFRVGARFAGMDDLILLPLDRYIEERALRTRVAEHAAALVA